jgi:hypothetical protein
MSFVLEKRGGGVESFLFFLDTKASISDEVPMLSSCPNKEKSKIHDYGGKQQLTWLRRVDRLR